MHIKCAGFTVFSKYKRKLKKNSKNKYALCQFQPFLCNFFKILYTINGSLLLSHSPTPSLPSTCVHVRNFDDMDSKFYLKSSFKTQFLMEVSFFRNLSFRIVIAIYLSKNRFFRPKIRFLLLSILILKEILNRFIP